MHVEVCARCQYQHLERARLGNALVSSKVELYWECENLQIFQNVDQPYHCPKDWKIFVDSHQNIVQIAETEC